MRNPLDLQLVLISGKGGVGKSAIATALALRGARAGRKVLVLGMVDSMGLADHLGAEHLAYDPHEFVPGLFAVGVDRPRALDEYLRLQLRVPKAAPTQQITRALNVLVDTAPGIREIVSMGKPVYEVWRKTWDLIVVDAPPLGQLFSYLRAPTTVSRLVPAGRIRDQSAAMERVLANPDRSGLILVTNPAELPASETTEAIERLEAEPVVSLLGLVHNRVLDPLGMDDAAVDALPPGPARDAAQLHRHVAADQARWLQRLPPGVQLPFLFGLLTPGEVAARLADLWDAAA